MVPVFIITSNLSFAEHPDTASSKIKNKFNLILSASEKFDIDPKVLSSIIYVERTLNYDWEDDALDIILADAGLNSSIGFRQVKLKTAYWIEIQLSDSTSKYFSGEKYKALLDVSKSSEEILNKLESDSLNILSRSKIIQNRWENEGYSIDDRPEIMGTLYSTGLFYRNGKVKENLTKILRRTIFGEKVRAVIKSF